MAAGRFEAMVDDLRALLRLAPSHQESPSAASFPSHTLRCTPESGIAVGTTGPSVRRTKVHAAVDTLGHRLALRIILAAEQDRWLQESTLAATVQEAYGQHVEVAYNGPRIQRGESAEGARCRASGLRW